MPTREEIRPAVPSMIGRAAVAACFAVALVLGSLIVVDPGLAGRLAAEDAEIEWIQVVLCSVALLVSLGSAWTSYRSGHPVLLNVLIVAALAAIVIGEVDIDKRLFGVKIISTRFFVDPHIFLPYRMLAVAVVVGVPLAIGLYALRNWRQLWLSGVDALRHAWGRVLLAGVLTFVAAQIFERPLGRVPGFPRFFLEEALELVAAIWFMLAVMAHRLSLVRELRRDAIYFAPASAMKRRLSALTSRR
jgi:hypothetical protein